MDRKHTIGTAFVVGAALLVGGAAVYISSNQQISQPSQEKVDSTRETISSLEERIAAIENRLKLPDSAVESIDLRQEFSVYAQNLGLLSRENAEINKKIDNLTERVDQLAKGYEKINQDLAARYDVKPLSKDDVKVYLDNLLISHPNAPGLNNFYSRQENRDAFEKEANRYLGIAVATGNKDAYLKSMLWAIKQFKEDGKNVDDMPEYTEEQKIAKRLAQVEKSNAFQSDFLKAAVGVDLSPSKKR